MLGLVCGLAAGLLLPVQTCLNSRLREAVGSPFVSSLGSFTGGTFFLLFLALLIEHSVGFPLANVVGQPAWMWIGGVLGVIGLTTNIFIFPKLGAMQSVVIPIAGQILMGLTIDHFGLFHAKQTDLSLVRLSGAVLVIAGVFGAVTLGSLALSRYRVEALSTDTFGTTTAVGEPGLWGWRILALVSGFFMGTQAAVNGYLGTVIGSSLKAALISFSVGVLSLLAIVLVKRIPLRLQVPAGKIKNPWWMWCGGPLGALFVFAMAALVPILGTGLTIVVGQLGMISGSLLVDKLGILEAQRRPVSLAQVASLFVMLAGVLLIRLT